jgi:hypothetical protein
MSRGRMEEGRRMLLCIGSSKFGEPSSETLATLESISNLDHLEALGKRLPHVASWQELLANGG